MLKIKVINYETGESYEKKLTPETLIQSGVLIGRQPSCDLILSSPEVSRVHGKIEYQQGQYYFTDLGSTDGSQVNGKEVLSNQRLLLKPDDVIRIGDFILLVKDVVLNVHYTTDRGHTIGRRPDQAVAKIDAVQIPQLIFKVEDLKNQGVYSQGSSEFRFQGKLLVEGLSLSKPLRRKAVALCQAELDMGKFCILVEYSDHFTVWHEKSI